MSDSGKFTPESKDGILAILWRKFNILNKARKEQPRDKDGAFTK